MLVSYPADAVGPWSKIYLKSSIKLPAACDFRPTNAEAISVVLFRTGMGVTEVNEVRDVLRLWAGALARPEPTDLLRWRQRTGYDFGYLATRERTGSRSCTGSCARCGTAGPRSRDGSHRPTESTSRLAAA